MVTYLKHMFDPHYRSINRLQKKMKTVRSYRDSYMKLDEEEFQNQVIVMKEQIASGKDEAMLVLQATALVSEAVRRIRNIRMHDVQMIGGLAMLEGCVIEMLTGEGKTLVSLIPAFWYGAQGRGVHLITTNDYLAQRDYEEMKLVLNFLGLTVGLNCPQLSVEEKQEVYAKHVTYGTWSEFGFDYLRNQIAPKLSARAQPPLATAIIDEIDSVLIDEARTPLILAGKEKVAPDLYYICSQFIQTLAADVDFEVDDEIKQVAFTEKGIEKVESTFMTGNLFDIDNINVYHHLLQSLKAHTIMKRDVDYIIQDHRVEIVDPFTGRVLTGREFSHGLHQAIEAKENLKLSEETRTQASITVQKFFSLYPMITGMTGTISTEKLEIKQIYGLETLTIPPHRPVIREDLPDLIFRTKQEKYQKMIEKIKLCRKKGQPVLIGTSSIQHSEEIAALLKTRKIPYKLLNAKSAQEEAQIIAKAGKRGAVTIATNMAGRGTDIRLGKGIQEVGGLYVIGTERHESRRIDNQLRGRAGRQGDPGLSQYFLSLEDELFQRFANWEEETKIQQMWQWGDQGTSSPKLQMMFEQVQKRAEQQMFDIRSFLFQLDSIVHDQRQSFYRSRDEILNASEIENYILFQMERYATELVERWCPIELVPEEWNLMEIKKNLDPIPFPLQIVDLAPSELEKMIHQSIKETLETYWKSQDMVEWRKGWKAQYLHSMDVVWQEQLETLEQMKQGIHYRIYEGRNPIQAYQEDAFRLFQKFKGKWNEKIAREILKKIKQSSG
ncbi:helicase-related protein [Ammoniphilus sp. CFH 90114]|uniref:preprotein translocase subunit SecA n=1 Tax=Ammoniphilus sp. CFH 90114 TaxID=2493665 RepID=UPI00100FBA0C|nr:helicase-related protein [Ammoniphilus sp. CFH 90114]RXT02844.1 accessory Sec system translocase SecA2 [Ammoniphilus sp. CFH 90114]